MQSIPTYPPIPEKFPPYYHITIMLEWPGTYRREIIAEFKHLYRYNSTKALASIFEISESTVCRWAKVYNLHERGKRRALRLNTPFNKKIIINLENGVFYPSAKEAGEALNIDRFDMWRRLNGASINNTSLRYV